VFSFGIIVIAYFLKIFYSWKLFGGLKTTHAPLDATEDYLAGPLALHVLVPFLSAGLLLQFMAGPIPREDIAERVVDTNNPSASTPLLRLSAEP